MQANSQACALDLAMPGTLPVLNGKAVEMALKFGLAIGARIHKCSIFARKNYFYPDLPKGYQISQFEKPIVGKGFLDIQISENKTKRIGITRAHLEEDAGKSLHDVFDSVSAIDLNRAGVPLLEIVSDPDMRSAQEAVFYAKKIHSLVEYLGISDGNMQEGSFRCDANISLRSQGEKEFGVRAEIKNINSFRFLEKALNYEIFRQKNILEKGGRVIQETRLYDAVKDETRSMRSKEESNDYRYFPDPDLLPLEIDDDLLARLKEELVELPDARKMRFMHDLKLSAYDADFLSGQKALADYFEAALKITKYPLAKLLANWITVELMALLNKHHKTISNAPISPKNLAQLVIRIADGTISGKIAKNIFSDLWQGADVDTIIKQKGLIQITDTKVIAKVIDTIIATHPKQVSNYQNGNARLLGFFVGKVMKETKGKANPKQVNILLQKKLAL